MRRYIVEGTDETVVCQHLRVEGADETVVCQHLRVSGLLRMIIFSIGILVTTNTLGQSVEGQEQVQKNWQLSGYVKNLQTMLFFNKSFPNAQFQPVDTFLQNNLLHNRLNFRWFPTEELTLAAELRTRIFYGDLVKASPDYGAEVDRMSNDYFDFSVVPFSGKSWAMHSIMDRFYLEYIKNNWEIRLGRQRVNWGISTVWNPNDIFNAFNFTDFDYEERPGSDALRVRYFTGFASSVELVVNAFDDLDDATIAGLWKFNKWQYDFQVLGGFREQDLVLGGGWAGNIKNAGFKGEFTYFYGLEEERQDGFAMTLGLDYSFSNATYVNLGYLYNSLGASNTNAGQLFSFDLSAKNLYPYRHSIFAQASHPVTPLLNAGLAVIYSPVDVHALFVNPSITYSVRDNWDLDLLGQLVFNKGLKETYTSPIQAVFLRLKVSF